MARKKKDATKKEGDHLSDAISYFWSGQDSLGSLFKEPYEVDKRTEQQKEIDRLESEAYDKVMKITRLEDRVERYRQVIELLMKDFRQ